ncbi:MULTISPECIES: hypothetical protein [unclassified Streptomyces]|uniref:hypothetical protein n=1 Tax=unclassified Streptomyces TaxID=2593676 RepID=UPI002E819F95|nr:hypothetical protein [Streptomyces sp. NBC_00589]WTI34407.1 hypothetical protein OIC96_05050 [Streptomyces sp. NBC_00775]WUB31921.1 hypothetical protein OHA51_44680 [Streptomyces sp. NBC_00589]
MSRRYGGNPAGTVISIIADIAALILILWIALYLFDANTANSTVSWVHDAANWLSGWSRNLFTIHSDNWRTVVNYGLPAVVYLLIGHAVAGRVNQT